jgi:hypothetical protein
MKLGSMLNNIDKLFFCRKGSYLTSSKTSFIFEKRQDTLQKRRLGYLVDKYK